MKRCMSLIVALCVMQIVNASVTTHLKLDCRTGMREPAAEGEELRYDASWCEGGEEARISDNGAVITNGVAGSYIWNQYLEPCSTSNHVLKLEILANGEVVGIETAQFATEAPTAEHITVITQPAVAPTSGKPGRTAEIRCLRCGEVVQAATEIPALGYIRNVTARQLWPHNKVEVCYTLADDIGEIVDNDDEIVLFCSNGKLAAHVLGDCRCVPGRHCVVWDMEADGISDDSAELSFNVSVMNAMPGFVAKTFTAPSLVFDKTSDVWAEPVSYVSNPDGLYASSLAEHTTMAYGCYMWMVGGVTYSFKGRYDDFRRG